MTELNIGDVVTSTSNKQYKIIDSIGSGGQGSVWKVSDGRKNWALKWYKTANNEKKSHFLELVRKGAPTDKQGKIDRRFIWPKELVTSGDGIGYIMELLEKNINTTLFRAIADDRDYPRLRQLCIICANIADAFNNLHNEGWCYKDLSSENIYFDIKTGEVRIIDVDNVTVSGRKGSVRGTPRFMAPEVVMRKVNPDKEADRFSLAAMFFWFITGNNPLEGKLREDYVARNGVFDERGFDEVFGSRATFCFNKMDRRNNLDAEDYKYVVKRWENIVPQKLKKLFEKTFVDGLSFEKRNNRTTDPEWYNVFTELSNKVKRCSCGYEYLEGAGGCYKCGKKFNQQTDRIYANVMEAGKSSLRQIVFGEGILPGSYIGSSLSSYSSFAEVLRNPNTGELGLRNLSNIEWYYKDAGVPDLSPVPSNKIVTLKKGRIIAFIRRQIQIEVL